MRWAEDVAQTEITNTGHTVVGIHGRTIKFANSLPCACRGSTGQKP